MEWAILPLKKYAEFTGRARRKEYWLYVLLIIVLTVVASIIDRMLGMKFIANVYGPVYLLVVLATLIPSLAVGVRRLHDTNRSGWWLLIGLIPLLGALVLLFFFVTEGTRGDNQYGPDPKAAEA